MSEQKLFSVQQAAREYFCGKISRAKIYQLVQQNQIESIHVGKRILIPESSLDSFCQLNSTVNSREKEVI